MKDLTDQAARLAERVFDEQRERVDRARALLPAWFVTRMMDDTWTFGLLLVTGQTLIIDTINDVRGIPGNIWIDVVMADKDAFDNVVENYNSNGWKYVHSPTRRTTASVNAAHVVMALELADT